MPVDVAAPESLRVELREGIVAEAVPLCSGDTVFTGRGEDCSAA